MHIVIVSNYPPWVKAPEEPPEGTSAMDSCGEEGVRVYIHVVRAPFRPKPV
jgi:hypothetical protein